MEPRLYTAADLEHLDLDHPVELDRGVLVHMNPPKLLHGLCCANICHLLKCHLDKHSVGVVFTNDSGYKLEENPDTVRGPDVSLLLRTRLESVNLREYPLLAPDIAVEVLSGDDTPARVQKKVALYLEMGSKLVWVVDPWRHRVTVYHADGTVDSLLEADSLTGEPVLPGFTAPVAELFAY